LALSKPCLADTVFTICDVTNQHGDTIAMFRGKSAQIQGTVIPA